MGLLDFIFGKTIKINDDFFGEMRFMKIKKNPSKNYFECKRNFQPIGKDIEIGIEGDVEGPIQKQKDFFRRIEKNYPEYCKEFVPIIENEFKNWKEDFVIKNFNEEFIPVYLWIPRCESTPIIWEIAFESGHDLNHTFNVTMNDDKAKEILIDG